MRAFASRCFWRAAALREQAARCIRPHPPRSARHPPLKGGLPRRWSSFVSLSGSNPVALAVIGHNMAEQIGEENRTNENCDRTQTVFFSLIDIERINTANVEMIVTMAFRAHSQ